MVQKCLDTWKTVKITGMEQSSDKRQQKFRRKDEEEKIKNLNKNRHEKRLKKKP